jgi:hypothetical protein
MKERIVPNVQGAGNPIPFVQSLAAAITLPTIAKLDSLTPLDRAHESIKGSQRGVNETVAWLERKREGHHAREPQRWCFDARLMAKMRRPGSETLLPPDPSATGPTKIWTPVSYRTENRGQRTENSRPVDP